MSGGKDFAYANARMQARLGARPGIAAWEALQANVGFRAFLEQARATALAPWLSTIAPAAEPHAIEFALRAQLDERFEEVASWLPRGWRDAVRWSARLVELPARAHLLAGRGALPWMARVPALAAPAAAGASERGAPGAGPVASPAGAPAGAAAALREQWLAQWRARWPRVAPAHARRLEQLVTLARAHAEDFAADSTATAASGWPARRALEHRVQALFRRACLEPAAPFAFLVLLSLDYERLRGGLLTRALFETASS